MAVNKSTGWRPPYTSATFREIANLQVGSNGLLAVSGDVTQLSGTITVPAFTAIQQGLIFSKNTSTAVTAPSRAAPYHLTVTSPAPTNIDNLVWGFAYSEDDIVESTVIFATYDGVSWRTAPIISNEGLLQEIWDENVLHGRVGPYDGLETSISAGNYITTAGSLIDQQGERQRFSRPFTHPVVAADPDLSRVDRILYRRPDDFKNRAGYIKFELGGTYATSPVALHTTAISSDLCHETRAVIASDNTAHIFNMVGAGPYSLYYTKISSDRQSVLVSPIDLISDITHPGFDVVIDKNDGIHLVCTALNSGSDSVFYCKIDTSGAVIVAEAAVDSTSGACKNPRCAVDAGSECVYIVYQALEGSSNQIYFAKRNTDGTVATTQVKLSVTGSDLQNPSLCVTKDYVVVVAWSNITTGHVEYQRFDKYGAKLDLTPAVISSATTYGAGTLSGGAKNPRVVTTDNETLFIAFQQDKGGGKYGIAIWSAGSAYMGDLFSSTESFLSFDLFVDSIFNEPALILGRSTSTDLVKLVDKAAALVVNLSGTSGSFVSLVKDRLGSFLCLRANSSGAWFSKTPSEVFYRAPVLDELPTDVLISRLFQPQGTILGWVLGRRPGSFYDFLVAHGSNVILDWEATLPGTFILGPGLKILDMYEGINYTVDVGPVDGDGRPTTSAGLLSMAEGDALYVMLDGSTTVPANVAPLAQVPWYRKAVIIGTILEGQFNPGILGVAGMVQMDSGETVIFGQDLPQTIRARLGIISETAFQAYTSHIGLDLSDTYPQALSKIDIMAGQGIRTRAVRIYASWGKTAEYTLTLESNCYVQIPGLLESRNTIAAGSYALPNDGDALVVTVNRNAGADTSHTPVVAALSTLVLTRDMFILARRIGDNLSIETLGRLFKPGDLIREVHEDSLKPVRLIDRVAVSLPSGASALIDGMLVAEGDRVLFANPAINKVYIAYGVGASLTWLESDEFAGSATPNPRSCVLVWDGADINKTIWTYSSTKGWYRISSYEDTIEVRAMDLTTTSLPSGTSLVVDSVTILNGELVLFGHPSLNKIYRVGGVGSSLTFETMNLFLGSSTPSDGSLVLAQDGVVPDVIWEYDADLALWTAITVTYQNKQYLGLTSPAKTGGTYTDQIVTGQLNNVLLEGDTLERALKRLDIRPDTLKRVTAIDLISTVLPTGASCTIDGVLLADGDKVLFIKEELNGIYQIAGVGTTVTWTKLYEFAGSQSPTTKSVVFVTNGSRTNHTIWIFDTHYNPAWIKLVDPALLDSLYETVVWHTTEINQLQDQISSVLVNRPNFQRFVAQAGGQKIFTLTRFEINPDNDVFDIYTLYDGRWQSLSRLGDFSDGQYRKLSATQIELAETIPEGEEVVVYIWDPAGMFTRVTREQKFTAGVGGQSIFTLDPLIFAVEPYNDVIDCEYLHDGRWQTQSLLGNFSDGAVRKNSELEIETSEPIPEGREFIVIRRVPTGTAPGYSGPGGGGSGGEETGPIDPSAYKMISGGVIAEGQPIGIAADGSVLPVDVSSEQLSMGVFGVAMNAALLDETVYVQTNGDMVVLTNAYGSPVYAGKDGSLTTVKPAIGVDGFVAGDFVIHMGIVRLDVDSMESRLVINPRVVGVL